jgi:hypothetical protein
LLSAAGRRNGASAWPGLGIAVSMEMREPVDVEMFQAAYVRAAAETHPSRCG